MTHYGSSTRSVLRLVEIFIVAAVLGAFGNAVDFNGPAWPCSFLEFGSHSPFSAFSRRFRSFFEVYLGLAGSSFRAFGGWWCRSRSSVALWTVLKQSIFSEPFASHMMACMVPHSRAYRRGPSSLSYCRSVLKTFIALSSSNAFWVIARPSI